MNNQISDPYARGRYTPGFNETSDSRALTQKLRDLDLTASHFPPNDRKIYKDMRQGQISHFGEILVDQEANHEKEWQKKFQSLMQDGLGFDKHHTSPKIRRQMAEERATRFMAAKEQQEQEKHLKAYLRQSESFIEVAERQHKAQLEKQNTKGGCGR